MRDSSRVLPRITERLANTDGHVASHTFCVTLYTASKCSVEWSCAAFEGMTVDSDKREDDESEYCFSKGAKMSAIESERDTKHDKLKEMAWAGVI